MNNREKRFFGLAAVCFGLMRLFGNCRVIVRDCSDCSPLIGNSRLICKRFLSRRYSGCTYVKKLCTNGEKHLFGLESGCFWLKQSIRGCAGIGRKLRLLCRIVLICAGLCFGIKIFCRDIGFWHCSSTMQCGAAAWWSMVNRGAAATCGSSKFWTIRCRTASSIDQDIVRDWWGKKTDG